MPCMQNARAGGTCERQANASFLFGFSIVVTPPYFRPRLWPTARCPRCLATGSSWTIMEWSRATLYTWSFGRSKSRIRS